MDRLMAVLATGILLAVLAGQLAGDPKVSAGATMPAAVLATDVELPAAPTLAELEGASREVREQASKVSPEKTMELVEKVLDGAQVNFALAQFDAWLKALETRQMPLNSQDFEADLKELEDFAHEAGAPEEEIKKRVEKAAMLRNTSKA